MKNLIIFLFCFHISSLFAQNNTENNAQITLSRRKVFYFEAFGSSLGAGIHFDTRFSKGTNAGLGFRAGVGTIGGLGFFINQVLVAPIGINYIVGEKQHSFIVGGGIMPTSITYNTIELISILDIVFIPIPTTKTVTETRVYGEIGYRYSPKPSEKGIIFQITLNPIIGTDIAVLPGVAIGYSF
jgi:hypothetical protein